MSGSTTLGTARPPKGIIGWISEDTLVVVGGGQDARWEKFVVLHETAHQPQQQQHGYGTAHGGQQQDGGTRRVCVREGWRRYLGSP